MAEVEEVTVSEPHLSIPTVERLDGCMSGA